MSISSNFLFHVVVYSLHIKLISDYDDGECSTTVAFSLGGSVAQADQFGLRFIDQLR